MTRWMIKFGEYYRAGEFRVDRFWSLKSRVSENVVRPSSLCPTADSSPLSALALVPTCSSSPLELFPSWKLVAPSGLPLVTKSPCSGPWTHALFPACSHCHGPRASLPGASSWPPGAPLLSFTVPPGAPLSVVLCRLHDKPWSGTCAVILFMFQPSHCA